MTLRKRFIARGLAAAVASGSFAAQSVRAETAWKFSANYPPDHPASVRYTQMCAGILKESGGRLKIDYFPSSQLGGDVAVLNQVRLGAVQMVGANLGTLAGIIPSMDIFNICFVFQDAKEAFRVMDGSLGAYVRRDASTKGVFLFEKSTDAGMFQIGSATRSVRGPDDLRGFKIRTTLSKIIADMFKIFGADPVALSAVDTYTGLQTKIIDGEAAPLPSIQAQRWFEGNKYISLTNHGWAGTWDTVNADAWQGLPPDVRAIVERNHRKYVLMERRDNFLLDQSVGEKLSRQGIAINKVDQAPFRAKLNSYFQYWTGAFGPTVWKLLESSLGRTVA